MCSPVLRKGRRVELTMGKAVVLAWLTLWLIVGSPASGYGQAGDAGYALRFPDRRPTSGRRTSRWSSG